MHPECVYRESLEKKKTVLIAGVHLEYQGHQSGFFRTDRQLL